MRRFLLSLLLVVFCLPASLAQEEDEFVFGDPLPDAPALAARGTYQVGVRTFDFVNPDQVNILSESEDTAIYDRPITVEVWYPAVLGEGQPELVEYDEILGNVLRSETLIPYTFRGRAARDAEANYADGPYPLIIVSHGYPGSRFMLTYLNENLASKGYVVVAIDHTESTFGDMSDGKSALFNRAADQEFVLDEVAALSEAEGFFNGLADTNNAAIIGYSFGGYGALNAIGAGYGGPLRLVLGDAIAPRLESNEDYLASIDPRFRVAVLFAPWGGDLTGVGFSGVSIFTPTSVANITIPTLWIAGSEDDVSFYDAIVGLFDNSINSERYLLTYQNARHNVAPNPPPPEATTLEDYERYAEFAWDERRINNINQHFVTAFLGVYLKGDESLRQYLDLEVELASEGVISLDDAGNPTEEHSYWAGFPRRTAVGLEFRSRQP